MRSEELNDTRAAIDLLDRIYGLKAGEALLDDEMALDWIQREIAAFIRNHGTFASLHARYKLKDD